MPSPNNDWQPRVAVIDDELISRREIKRGLERENRLVEIFADGSSALKRMNQVAFDLVICDLKLPDINGLEILQRIKKRFRQTEVIMITGFGSVESAIEAIRSGAFHYVTKPVKMAELRALAGQALTKVKLRQEKEALENELFSSRRNYDLIGNSPATEKVRQMIKKVAPLSCNVLIQGESGTGKELVARALHLGSPRKDNAFISFNCGSFTEELIANELFGHEKGAFTGAVETKIGLLEAAHQGTIFLDEIATMPASMQVKLLRFVQERNILRVGGIKPITVDVRMIAASNQELNRAVENGKFRQDLYYRLKVVLISLPPLRSRLEDIPLLVKHFISRYSEAFGKQISGVSPQVLGILENYPFPGNVRELEHIIESAVALAENSTIEPVDLPPDIQKLSFNNIDRDKWPSLQELEKAYIQKVLVKTGYKKQAAARLLKIPRTTLWRKLKRYNIQE